ncbi:MAG TPA: polysaccharide deacetylase family protein [Acidimicrobiales bacterium]|nr:polysaccharide deacetylase family protein [Acidimicrobiales bacterium]
MSGDEDPSRRPIDRRALLQMGAAGVVGAVASAVVVDKSAQPKGVSRREVIERSDAAGVLAGREVALGTHTIVWSVATEDPVLTFTFDDGPDPEFTPKVLEILGRFGVSATFNVMGYNAERHQDELRAVVAAGHELGNHTYRHVDLAFTDPARTRRELEEGVEVIRAVSGVDTVRWFRPPRGELTGVALRAAAALDHDILLWSVSGDVAGIERPADVRAFVDAHLQPGQIVSFHDGIGRGTFDPRGRNARQLRERRAAEVAALPAIIDAALSSGLRLVTASELLEHRID